MNSVFVVFSREKSNPFAARVVVGITDTIEAARRMTDLTDDSFVDCVIQEWDIASLQDLNNEVPWDVTVWKNLEDVAIRRAHPYNNAKTENRLISQSRDSAEFLIWADNKYEAIEEARRMLNERSN